MCINYAYDVDGVTRKQELLTPTQIPFRMSTWSLVRSVLFWKFQLWVANICLHTQLTLWIFDNEYKDMIFYLRNLTNFSKLMTP